MRLNKYLSDAGVCSRREADRLVQDRRVMVDGKTAVLGMQIQEGQEILVNGKKVRREEKKVLLLFHKPRGIECTANPKIKKNVISYIDYPIRIYYIGRLDKDSEGLLLLTNQGELVNKMMRAGNCHEKEYLVTVDKPVTDEGLNRQIRRMCEYLGYRVERLVRVRVMNLELGDLPVGQYREAAEKELENLKSLIQDSSETTVIRKNERRKR